MKPCKTCLKESESTPNNNTIREAKKDGVCWEHFYDEEIKVPNKQHITSINRIEQKCY